MLEQPAIGRDRLIEALGLSAEARVDQRVPKKLFVEQGAVTPADKKLILDGIEEIIWIAALKPTSIGVATYRDELREYLEIAVLSVILRQSAKIQRIVELVHRAIPYPVVLIATQGDKTSMSLAHQRFAQNEADKSILDGNVVVANIGIAGDAEESFLKSISLANQPLQNLYALYQGWIERIETLLAARITGKFIEPRSSERAAARRSALKDTSALERELISLRAQAAKEKQMNRRVELNLKIQQLKADAREKLDQL